MGAYTPLLHFNAWYLASSPVIPDFYWDVVSSEQRVKEICCRLAKLIDYANQQNTNLGALKNELTALEEEFEKFKESGFFDYYAQQVEQWIKDNIAYLWSTFASQCYFGLTDNGYFCAYVPDSWSDIDFDTGMQYGTETYGRLILRYDVSEPNQGVIDNTAPDYVKPFN